MTGAVDKAAARLCGVAHSLTLKLQGRSEAIGTQYSATVQRVLPRNGGVLLIPDWLQSPASMQKATGSAVCALTSCVHAVANGGVRFPVFFRILLRAERMTCRNAISCINNNYSIRLRPLNGRTCIQDINANLVWARRIVLSFQYDLAVLNPGF